MFTSGLFEPDIVEALRAIDDPELGVSIVDLGLIYRAERTSEGIRVAMTLTTPSCPMSEMLVEQAQDALRQCFPESPEIRVELVWSPPWSPACITDAARRQLGWPDRAGVRTRTKTARPSISPYRHPARH